MNMWVGDIVAIVLAVAVSAAFVWALTAVFLSDRH